MRVLSILLLLAAAGASAQDVRPKVLEAVPAILKSPGVPAPVKTAVAKKAVVASANSKVAAVKPNIPPCSDLDKVEKMLPSCDVSLPETRDSVECRVLLKGAGSSTLGTDLEIGRIRGATFSLPASAKEGKVVKLGGTGSGALFAGSVAPADFNKPVGFTLRAFDGAAPLGEKLVVRTTDKVFLGTPDNLAGGAVGVLVGQCDEIKVQPGSRVVCGVCLLSTDNVKEILVSPDAANKEVVSLPLKDGDTELGAVGTASGAESVSRSSGALFVAAAAAAVAAVVAL